ncbi:hypothetical protein EGR_07333 [Echinococcus granulosus]|uniref:Uncharacterized protein n=1 Tax=Echinococcus granulosus TaxID=6210 RepID=W6UIC9_ECHGR|nr:hypothetical protein EGR_07333 [Echinococcus granulosus]EUB57862.1 hypothetical protein EGR_07333 [Echinococcus granulosus]
MLIYGGRSKSIISDSLFEEVIGQLTAITADTSTSNAWLCAANQDATRLVPTPTFRQPSGGSTRFGCDGDAFVKKLTAITADTSTSNAWLCAANQDATRLVPTPTFRQPSGGSTRFGCDGDAFVKKVR